MKYFLTLFILCFLVACNPSWPHRYDTLAPDAPFHGYGKVVVLVRDNRPIVIEGSRSPHEVGMVESMKSQYPIQIATGHALAQDVGIAVCNSLIGRGYECVPLVSGRAEIEEELSYIEDAQSPNRVMYISIEDWDVNVFLKTKIQYAFSLKVFNASGDTRASLATSGSEELGSVTTINPAKEASNSVPLALSKILSSLLSHSQVVSSMNMTRDIDVLGSRY